MYKSRLFGKETDLSEGAPVLKLSIANGETYHGNATKEFKPAQPFRFMGVKGTKIIPGNDPSEAHPKSFCI